MTMIRPSSSNPDPSKEANQTAANAVASNDASPALTRREWLGTLGLAVAIAAGAGVIAWITGKARGTNPGAESLPGPPRHLGAFQLTDQTGHITTEADLAGKILVVNFVFTSCSLSCRVVNTRMEEIQNLVADLPDVRFISFTVDPRTDTPPVLARFAEGFHAKPDRWRFLTGEKDQLYTLLETTFIPRSEPADPLVPGGFTGTDRIMLVDRNGAVSRSFKALENGSAAIIASEIRNLAQTGTRQPHP